jgi:hypothetical protein
MLVVMKSINQYVVNVIILNIISIDNIKIRINGIKYINNRLNCHVYILNTLYYNVVHITGTHHLSEEEAEVK